MFDGLIGMGCCECPGQGGGPIVNCGSLSIPVNSLTGSYNESVDTICSSPIVTPLIYRGRRKVYASRRSSDVRYYNLLFDAPYWVFPNPIGALCYEFSGLDFHGAYLVYCDGTNLIAISGDSRLLEGASCSECVSGGETGNTPDDAYIEENHQTSGEPVAILGSDALFGNSVTFHGAGAVLSADPIHVRWAISENKVLEVTE